MTEMPHESDKQRRRVNCSLSCKLLPRVQRAEEVGVALVHRLLLNQPARCAHTHRLDAGHVCLRLGEGGLDKAVPFLSAAPPELNSVDLYSGAVTRKVTEQHLNVVICEIPFYFLLYFSHISAHCWVGWGGATYQLIVSHWVFC